MPISPRSAAITDIWATLLLCGEGLYGGFTASSLQKDDPILAVLAFLFTIISFLTAFGLGRRATRLCDGRLTWTPPDENKTPSESRELNRYQKAYLNKATAFLLLLGSVYGLSDAAVSLMVPPHHIKVPQLITMIWCTMAIPAAFYYMLTSKVVANDLRAQDDEHQNLLTATIPAFYGGPLEVEHDSTVSHFSTKRTSRQICL